MSHQFAIIRDLKQVKSIEDFVSFARTLNSCATTLENRESALRTLVQECYIAWSKQSCLRKCCKTIMAGWRINIDQQP